MFHMVESERQYLPMYAGFPATAPATTEDLLAIPMDEHTRPDGAVLGLRPARLTRVIVDIHVALHIAKHARESGTRTVSGTLYGIQIGNAAEVTGAVRVVPQPSERNEEDKRRAREKEREEHSATVQLMIDRCRLDPCQIGRYVCCSHSQQIHPWQLRSMEEAIRNGEPSMLLVYDPLRSATGKLYLTAYVLSDQYIKLLRTSYTIVDKVKSEALSSDIFVPIPVQIHANPLQQLALYTIAQKPRAVKNVLVAQNELGRYTERALHHLTEDIASVKDTLMYVKKKTQDTEHGGPGVPALKADAHLAVQRLREQANHLHAISAGSAQVLDFARKL